MVPPRLKVGASKYWLRARSGHRSGGKIIVSVDSLYNILKDNQGVRTRNSDSNTATGNAASASGPNTQPAIRQSPRLFNKRASLLRSCTRGGPQYWLRTRSKGNKRSVLVSVKSLYTAPGTASSHACISRISNTRVPLDQRMMSICLQMTPLRARLMQATAFDGRAHAFSRNEQRLC